MKVSIFVFLIILLICNNNAFAVTPGKGDLLSDNFDVKISAENFSGQADSDKFHLWGNVKLEKDEQTLIADDIIFNSKTNIAVASGKVYFSRPGSELWTSKLTVEYKKRKGYCEGGVKMIQTEAPKKGGSKIKSSFKNGPVTIICDEMNFSWMRPSRAEAEGRVEVHQKDKHIYGDSITYKSLPETLIIEGNVRFQKNDGSSMTCHNFTMNLKKNTFEAVGTSSSQVTLDFYFDKKRKKK